MPPNDVLDDHFPSFLSPRTNLIKFLEPSLILAHSVLLLLVFKSAYDVHFRISQLPEELILSLFILMSMRYILLWRNKSLLYEKKMAKTIHGTWLYPLKYLSLILGLMIALIGSLLIYENSINSSTQSLLDWISLITMILIGLGQICYAFFTPIIK